MKKIEKAKLCKVAKTGLTKKNISSYAALVKDASFVCKSCGRTAASKKQLCSPKAIDDLIAEK